MNPLIAGPLLGLVGNLIERWFPDPEKKAQAEMAFLAATQDQEFRKIIAQLEVNAREAQSPHMFVAGWRPFVGWCSGLGFLYASIGQPLLNWAAVVHGWPPPPPIDTELLLYVLGGMLGLGALRTYEKTKGAAK
jgi:hypothetical protein